MYVEWMDEFYLILHNNIAYLTFPESIPPAYHFNGYLSFNMDRAAGWNSLGESQETLKKTGMFQLEIIQCLLVINWCTKY